MTHTKLKFEKINEELYESVFEGFLVEVSKNDKLRKYNLEITNPDGLSIFDDVIFKYDESPVSVVDEVALLKANRWASFLIEENIF